MRDRRKGIVRVEGVRMGHCQGDSSTIPGEAGALKQCQAVLVQLDLVANPPPQTQPLPNPHTPYALQTQLHSMLELIQTSGLQPDSNDTRRTEYTSAREAATRYGITATVNWNTDECMQEGQGVTSSSEAATVKSSPAMGTALRPDICTAVEGVACALSPTLSFMLRTCGITRLVLSLCRSEYCYRFATNLEA